MIAAHKLRTGLLANALGALLAAATIPSAGLLWGQHQKGDIADLVAPMTEPVIRQRLKIMGYTNVKLERPNTLRYRITATKEGKQSVMDLHPQTGEVREVVAGKTPARVWTMPVEPPNLKH